MKLEVNACDLGLSDKYGKCVAGLLAKPRPLRPLSAVGLWLGGTHVLAAATGYAGCPELGAVPSLLLGRPVATWCGPWDWADQHLRRVAPFPTTQVS